jgi:hypothetical protein
MPFEILEDPDGRPVTAKADADGVQRVAATIDAESGLAREETLETLASTVTAFLPVGESPAVVVAIKSAPTLTVEVAAGQTATVTPDTGASGIVARLAGITTQAVGEGGHALDVAAYQRGGAWDVALSPGDPGKPQFVQGVGVGDVPERLGTEDTLATRASETTALDQLAAQGATTAAVEALETEVADDATEAKQDATIAAVDELEADADATRIAAESIDGKTPTLGPQTMATSTSVVFATDHPILGSELYVGATQLSNANPVPVRGIVPSRTPTGTPVFAASGQIGTDGAGALLYLRMHVPSPAGTRYILLFDAAAATPPATANMIPGVTFPFTPTLGRAEQRFGYPVGFANGLKWAVSSTEHTYTAAADTANVFAQWVMS